MTKQSALADCVVSGFVSPAQANWINDITRAVLGPLAPAGRGKHPRPDRIFREAFLCGSHAKPICGSRRHDKRALLIPGIFARFGLSGAQGAWNACEESLSALPKFVRSFALRTIRGSSIHACANVSATMIRPPNR